MSHHHTIHHHTEIRHTELLGHNYHSKHRSESSVPSHAHHDVHHVQHYASFTSRPHTIMPISATPKVKPPAVKKAKIALPVGHPEFSETDIKHGLHTLGRHPLLLNVTFLGLNVRHTSLTDASMCLLEPYKNLMYVDISSNHVSDLSVFSSYSSLVQLNASSNELTECLNFSPPKCDFKNPWSSGHDAVGSMLTLANLSDNHITHIRDLSTHSFLECLLLRGNLITQISGLQNLRFLKVLDLAFNGISVIEGLDDLSIEELNLEGNQIHELSGLERLPNLATLNVAHNLISSLQPLSQSRSLVHVNLQQNKIEVIRQVEFLAELPWLRVVELAGNYCYTKPFFRERVIFRLPSLSKLDLTVISPEEKIRAFNLYDAMGGDIHLRRQEFHSVFPDSEFEDKGPTLVDDELELNLC